MCPLFYGEYPVDTNVSVKRSDRDCKRAVQAGIPSPDTSHPGVYKAVWVNPSDSPSTAARGKMSRINEHWCDTIPDSKPRDLERTASSISGEGFDMIGPRFGHLNK